MADKLKRPRDSFWVADIISKNVDRQETEVLHFKKGAIHPHQTQTEHHSPKYADNFIIDEPISFFRVCLSVDVCIPSHSGPGGGASLVERLRRPTECVWVV